MASKLESKVINAGVNKGLFEGPGWIGGQQLFVFFLISSCLKIEIFLLSIFI